MCRHARLTPVLVVLFSCLLGCAALAGAQIPDEFTNLQLLDPEISKSDLVSIMRDWAIGLDVRCSHCHVGPDNLVGMDFAADDKVTKQTARRMLKMSRTINAELLADLPTVESEQHQEHQVVSCYTCHRGQVRPPRNLPVLLGEVVQQKGVDAALEHYGELRSEHHGRGRYDFGADRLMQVAMGLLRKGEVEGAVQVLEANLGYHPDNAAAHAALGLVFLRSGNAESAEASYRKALEQDPEHVGAQRGLAMIEAAKPTKPSDDEPEPPEN